MYRLSNTIIGFLNLVTLLASIPIIGAGLWMARSRTTCESFLQTPLLVIGFVLLIVSLCGFIGACFHVGCALQIYLVVMIFIIVALLSITIFGYAVTGKGGGVDVGGRVYKEYHIDKYSSWLRKRIEDPHYWMTIKSCIFGSKTCANIVLWNPYDYLTKNMSPIQSGCCKPPTSCNYAAATMVAQDPDCYRWNNDPNILCYDCDSCKAGAIESIRMDWNKISILNIVMVLLFIVVCTIGCCALENAKRAASDYPYGHTRISKVRPRWGSRWDRWWHGRNDQLY